MLGKDKYLEKTSYLIFLILIFFSNVLTAQTTISKILNYNASLVNSSANFIQNNGIEIQEGKIYFGNDRIKIDYKHPQNITLVLSETKGVYINHNLQETQYFNTNKSFIRFFFKLLKSSTFQEKPKVEEKLIKINDSFILDDMYYRITLLYEDQPIKIRKIIILEDSKNLELSFFDHNNLEFFDKKFFSKIKKPSYLINTSRGEFINEKDLIKCLKMKILNGAAIDVLKDEHTLKFRKNIKSNLLIRFYLKNKKQNLYITPKQGGSNLSAWKFTENLLIDRLIKYEKNKI